MILAAEWYHNILGLLFAVVAALLMIVILLQRGKGVGLAGAFGGGGAGGTAFGAKTGDVLTWITIVAAVVVLTFAVVLNFIFVPTGPGLGAPTAPPGGGGAAPIETTPPPTGAETTTPIEVPVTGEPAAPAATDEPVTEEPAEPPVDEPAPPPGDGADAPAEPGDEGAWRTNGVDLPAVAVLGVFGDSAA